MFIFALILLNILTLGIIFSTYNIIKWGEHITEKGKEYLYTNLIVNYIHFIFFSISLVIYIISGSLGIIYASMCLLISLWDIIKEFKKNDSDLPIVDISLLVFYILILIGEKI